MIRFSKLLAVAAILFLPTLTLAGIDDFLKKISPPPKQGAQKGNKTEDLIFGGLRTLKAMAPIGYKEELAIGGAVALEAASRFGGLVIHPELEKYVTKVGSAVALTSDRPEIPYHFGILNTDEPNAFAAPGGYIFISKGILKLVRDEAELAGILGHEIAHVAKKHALNAIRRTQALSQVSEVTLTALDKDPKMFDSVVKETVSLIFDRGLSKSDELEADRIGTDFAFRVGYNPKGLEDFLKILGGTSNRQAGLLKTHPSPTERIGRLKNVLASPDYQKAASSPRLADRWTTVRETAKL